LLLLPCLAVPVKAEAVSIGGEEPLNVAIASIGNTPELGTEYPAGYSFEDASDSEA
jgi:hypothetical protein